MGYTTDFTGKMKCTPKLNPDQVAYINQFSNTRRMARDGKKCANMSDPLREKVGLPVGQEGEFFVGGHGFMGQDPDSSVIEFNNPPSTQPSLWCQWVASEDGKNIAWDGGEKFYEYIHWLQYIQENMLTPWGVKLDGKIKWRGEDSSDKGVILAQNGVITSKEGQEYKDFLAMEKLARQAKKEKKDIEEEVQPSKDQKPLLSIRQKM